MEEKQGVNKGPAVDPQTNESIHAKSNNPDNIGNNLIDHFVHMFMISLMVKKQKNNKQAKKTVDFIGRIWVTIEVKWKWKLSGSRPVLHHIENSLHPGRLMQISLTVSALPYMLTQLFLPFQ